jgi:hypothetical protein
MAATLAYTRPRPGEPAREASLVRGGLTTGLRLLVLAPLVVAAVRLVQPGNPIVARILALETVLIAATQVVISIAVVRKTPTLRILRALVPAALAGGVVATGDVVGRSYALHSPATSVILSVVAYDVVLGVVLALPVIVVLRAASQCRVAARKKDVDASAKSLITAYRDVLDESSREGGGWHLSAMLTHQLLRRHVRRTLEAIQRGYAKLALDRGLTRAEARDRQTIGDYLLTVPPMSKVVPISTAASIFVLWKLVPLLVAFAATVAAWFGGGRWGLADISGPISEVVPNEVVALVIDGLALFITFPLLMFALAPAIHRRDKLLAEYMVCEREVILMDDRLGISRLRRSRRLEYVMAALPAVPLALYGGAVLVYALAGLFVYPSPAGPLGGLVEKADLMHLGPVTGAVLAQAFLLAAAVWIAWIVDTRKTTRVVLL